MIANLGCLEGKLIAVYIELNGKQTVVRGAGAIYDDFSLGRCLRVVVDDDSGQYELLIRASEFQGEVLPGVDARCDYRIYLTSGSASVTAVR